MSDEITRSKLPSAVLENKGPFPAMSGSASLLQAAVHQLFVFANSYRERGHFQALDVVNGHLTDLGEKELRGFSALTRFFFRSTFSAKGREEEEIRQKQIQKEIIRALDTLKCHYRTIERFRNGTMEEKNLANLATDVLKRCNEIIREVVELSDSWRSRFVPFFLRSKGFLVAKEIKKTPISLPPFPSVETIYPPRPKTEEERIWRPLNGTFFSPSIFLFREEIYNPFRNGTPNQIRDAFLMKAITLIGQHSLRPPTMKETMQLVRETPIHIEKDSENPNIFSLSQVVLPFPGEWIETKGSFATTSGSSFQSRPIAESFQVSSKSTQTGFPHPQQYFWALASPLLPEHPLRPHAVPGVQAFLDRKHRIAYGLLPQGSLIVRAKVVLERKQKVLKTRQDYYLRQHQLLTEAIVWSSGTRAFAQDEWQIIGQFYQVVEAMSEPFPFLAKVQDLIMEYYLHEPYEKLSGDWLDFEMAVFVKGKPEERAAFVSKMLIESRKQANDALRFAKEETQEQDKQVVFEFIRYLGEKISIGAHSVMMQWMSEKVGFLPPSLSDFSRKLLTSAIKQATMFAEELEMGQGKDEEEDYVLLETLLGEQIERDLAIFSAPSFDRVSDEAKILAEQLQRYYRARAVIPK